jgi:predicted RNA-binding protein YlqC (UPF0109 family)
MAVRYYGVAVGGQNAPDVTIDTSTTSSDIELAVSDANLTAGDVDKKGKIVTALYALIQAVEEDTGL